jgi:hypothetical protein
MVWCVVDLQMEPGDFCHVELSNGAIEVAAMFYLEFPGSVARLSRLDIQGPGANSLGPGALRDLARWVMEVLDVDELRVEGATRTSGAGPGRRPAPIIFGRSGNTGAQTGRRSG